MIGGLKHRNLHDGRPSALKRWPWRELLFLTLANHLPRLWILDRYRYVLYRWAGIRQSGPCTLYGPLTVRPYGACSRISLGRQAFLNTETRFACNYDGVTIGDNALIGPRVSFETVGHELAIVDGRRRRTSAPITVEQDAWLGAGVTVLGGVTIGRGAVVAAGSVVTRDVPPFHLVGGAPARFIRALEEPASTKPGAP